MKTRLGFVSNSSSSSFLIMGKWLSVTPEDVQELREKGLKYYESDEDGPCVGVCFDIDDYETWGQFKKRVARTLTAAGIPSEAKDIRLCTGTYQN